MLTVHARCGTRAAAITESRMSVTGLVYQDSMSKCHGTHTCNLPLRSMIGRLYLKTHLFAPRTALRGPNDLEF